MQDFVLFLVGFETHSEKSIIQTHSVKSVLFSVSIHIQFPIGLLLFYICIKHISASHSDLLKHALWNKG